MARFDCNFTSYTLGRDVEIDVLIPSMTILPVMAEKGKDFTHKPDMKTIASQWTTLFEKVKG